MKQALFALGLLTLAAPAWAQSQCYSSPEVEAEQLLRLHSELMVVTVTCRTDSQGINLVPAYTGFTRDHIDSLHHAEQVMKLHYSKLYGGDGIEQLDKLRTRLGNEYGKKIAELSAPVFCQMYRDQALRLCHVSADELRTQVEQMVADEKTYERVCRAGAL